jgi:hypothetical protein
MLTNTNCETYGKSHDLVVILHAWTGTSKDLCGLRDTVKQSLPDADLLIPDYPGGLFSKADPIDIVEDLVESIDKAISRRSREADRAEYKRIILIGHSAGALLIRKVYLFAMGCNEGSYIPIPIKKRDWVERVERIILLAGMNRGFSVLPKPRHMSWSTYLTIRLGKVIAALTGLGSSILSLEKGSQFVANLRIQWIRLGQNPAIKLAPTIQILGGRDDMVSSEDNIDLVSGANFTYREVRNAGHVSILDFDHPNFGLERKEEFQYALETPLDKLEGEFLPNSEIEPKDNVVFIMHGIRDRGHWTKKVCHAVETITKKEKKSVHVLPAGYGYFPMLRFLFLGERQKNVRWFMDEYTEALARFPNAKIGFIGHSNGTYLIASALERYKACKVDYVAFAGSVVRRSYDWDKLVSQGRVRAIRNDIASADWVVGIFPGLFELFKIGDIGTGGHNGFQDNEGQKNANTYFKGGHGAAIEINNHASLARFALTGINKVDAPLVESQAEWVVLASKLCWVVWLVIVSLVIGIGFLVTFLAFSFGIPVAISLLIYVCLILLLLYTL